MEKVNIYNKGYSGAMIFFALAIFAFNFFNTTVAGFNSEAQRFYGAGALGFALIGTIFFIFGFSKSFGLEGILKILTLGFISESADETNNKFMFLSKKIWIKLSVAFIFTLFIGFISAQLQIWDTPDIYESYDEFNTLSSKSLAIESKGTVEILWNIGVNPAVVEDGIALYINVFLVMFFTFLAYLLYKITGFEWLNFSTSLIIILVIITAPIAATSLGFLPGFAQAHDKKAGQDLQFLAKATVFQTLNLYHMWAIGMFNPLPHFVHNSIYALGLNTLDPGGDNNG